MMYPRLADAYRDAHVKLATAEKYVAAIPSSLDVLAALRRVGDSDSTRADVIKHCGELKLKLSDVTPPAERPAAK